MAEYLFDLRLFIVILVVHLLQNYLVSETVIKRMIISVLETNISVIRLIFMESDQASWW